MGRKIVLDADQDRIFVPHYWAEFTRWARGLDGIRYCALRVLVDMGRGVSLSQLKEELKSALDNRTPGHGFSLYVETVARAVLRAIAGAKSGDNVVVPPANLVPVSQGISAAPGTINYPVNP